MAKQHPSTKKRAVILFKKHHFPTVLDGENPESEEIQDSQSSSGDFQVKLELHQGGWWEIAR